MDKALDIDPLLGPAASDLGWVPAPRYLLRRARILPKLKAMSRGRLLEVGPGAGSLLIEAALLGFDCEALELSAEARELALKLIARSGANIPVRANPPAEWRGRFDVLCAFDVLEHIEDDRATLEEWRSWLRPGGTMLLSVPAHTKLWSAGDEWAGHYRRYEREGLRALLERTGFTVERFECYGFPVSNLSERISAPMYARRILRGDATPNVDRRMNNDRSGTQRDSHLKLFPILSSMPGKWGLRLAFAIQNAFLTSDRGSGYIALTKATD